MSDTAQSGTTRPDIARFSEVDESDEAAQLIRFLEVAKAAPEIVAAKQEVLELLQADCASDGLDVGCGYGADVVALAERMGPGGRAFGVDSSEAMISEARRRATGTGLDLSYAVGDAHSLPFDDDTFDVCRIETVLQHLAEPARAVAEMVRVTRRGGRIAAFEFDQATLFMDHPDVELAELISAALTKAMAQGSIGRQLRRLFVAAGLADVAATPRVISQDPNFFRLMLGRPVAELLAAEVITPERADRWWVAMEAAAHAGCFSNGAIAFVVSGTVPS